MTRSLARVGVPTALLVLAIGLVGLPLVTAPYEVERLTTAVVLSLAVLGLVVLTGWSGQISLGHSAFVGVGAYTTAILVADHGWPHLATMAVAAALGLVSGAVAGLPALRVKGIYLALVSLALATVFPTLVQHFASVTGGTQGKAVPAFRPWFDGVAQDQWGYYVALAVAAPAFLLVRNLGRSRIGRALRATRDNETAAEAMGVHVAAHKLVAFAVSGALAATAGSLLVLVAPYPYVDARSFTIVLSIGLVTGLVVGGAGSVAGAAVGALFLERAPSVVTDVGHLDGSVTNLCYGALLVLLMRVMPGGAAGLALSLRARWYARADPAVDVVGAPSAAAEVHSLAG